MKRKQHWIQSLFPAKPVKRTKIVVKPPTKQMQKQKRSKYYTAQIKPFYSETNLETLTDVAPFLDPNSSEEPFYSIFPYLIALLCTLHLQFLLQNVSK